MQGPQIESPSASPLVVLLHGYMSSAKDLEPFARSLKVDADFAVPEGFIDLAPQGLPGRAWWPVDDGMRLQAIAAGPRDLSDAAPEGRAEACEELERSLAALLQENGDRPLVLGGFSQGAMLACDFVLRSPRAVAGLALLSGARICADAWRPLYVGRKGLPVFMSHGSSDPDLSFDAALALAEDFRLAGWEVTFVAFDGGHEVPIAAWRALKKWLAQRGRSSSAPPH